MLPDASTHRLAVEWRAIVEEERPCLLRGSSAVTATLHRIDSVQGRGSLDELSRHVRVKFLQDIV
jgi:hypothetical protein